MNTYICSMNTLIITPKNKTQAQKIHDFAKSLGLVVNELSSEDKEDASILKAMMESEKKSQKNVSLSTFFKTLRS